MGSFSLGEQAVLVWKPAVHRQKIDKPTLDALTVLISSCPESSSCFYRVLATARMEKKRYPGWEIIDDNDLLFLS
jgi:hypothetical protein